MWNVEYVKDRGLSVNLMKRETVLCAIKSNPNHEYNSNGNQRCSDIDFGFLVHCMLCNTIICVDV